MNGIDLGSAEMIIQYGFAGFSLLLLAVLVWMIKKFVQTQKDSIEVLQQLTASINRNDSTNQQVLNKVEEMKGKLQSRPCIAKKE